MLKIMINKGKAKSSGSGQGVANLSSAKNVTASCASHLVLADLPVAKSIGPVPTAAHVKTVGFKVGRQAGQKVHFCVICDFPIAVYGRLSPCEHVFCLDCAKSSSTCHKCGERVQKIQAIKLDEPLFMCAEVNCHKSFLEKAALVAHIHETHTTPEGLTVINGGADKFLEVKPLPLPPIAPGGARPLFGDLFKINDESGNELA